MNPLIIPLIQALAPIAIELATKIAKAIQSDDLSELTPEDWIELLKHKALTSDERLMAILKKYQPNS